MGFRVRRLSEGGLAGVCRLAVGLLVDLRSVCRMLVGAGTQRCPDATSVVTLHYLSLHLSGSLAPAYLLA